MNIYALIVDDHPLVCKSLSEFLRSLDVVQEVIGVTTEADALTLLSQRQAPRLVLMDYWLGAGGSLSLMQILLAQSPQPRVLVMSGDDRPAIAQQVRRSGAHGFVGKREDPARLTEAVQTVLAGKTRFCADLPVSDWAVLDAASGPRTVSVQELGLTPQQGEVLALMLQGQPNRQIATRLAMPEADVKEHIRIVLQQLGAPNRLDAITKLASYKLIS
jgi:DNA-binding NarL/FixJ family response regulator